MIEKTLYGKHYDRVHALWERACLGYNCRAKWCRRHNVAWSAYGMFDPIARSLSQQCGKYYKLLQYLKDGGR